MALKKKPVTGMRDILPGEMQIRNFVMNQIQETYKGFGFSQIETPCVEHIGNLTSKQGGDNEKLIFKILKRGEKLNLETAKEENDLVDSGLRGLAFFGLLEGITSTLDVPVDLIDVSQIEKGSHIEMEIQQTGVPIYEQ